jgi:hypothetical protein
MLPSFGRSGAVVGVGHNPEAVPLVGRTNGGSGNAVPKHVIPERVQVREDLPERLASVDAEEARRVLKQRVRRLEFHEKAGASWPQPSVVPTTTRPAGANRRRLTRKSACNDVNAVGDAAPGDAPDVAEVGDVRPVAAQDG